MKIILVHKAEIQKRPPVISSLLILSDLGHELILATEGITDYWRNELHNRGIIVEIIPNSFSGKLGVIGKIISYYNFRKSFQNIIHKYFIGKDDELIWVEGAYTIVALGKMIQKHKYILQIQELHENSKIQLNAIRKVIHQAKCVFMPEYNRTILYQCWFKLKKRPILLPNKPYFLPTENQLEKYSVKYAKWIEALKRKKIILYQGHIHEERDLSFFIKAIKEMPQYQLVLLGKDHGILNKYKAIDSNIIHIDFIPAPDYLFFTSLCHIGIVSYASDTLNTAYCAPNKIYEYAAYGKPMLGNDIPGLKVLESNNIGILVNEKDISSIKIGIQKLEDLYRDYSFSASNFYKLTNNKKTIDDEISSIDK